MAHPHAVCLDPTVYGDPHRVNGAVSPKVNPNMPSQTWLDELEMLSERFHYEDMILEEILFGTKP